MFSLYISSLSLITHTLITYQLMLCWAQCREHNTHSQCGGSVEVRLYINIIIVVIFIMNRKSMAVMMCSVVPSCIQSYKNTVVSHLLLSPHCSVNNNYFVVLHFCCFCMFHLPLDLSLWRRLTFTRQDGRMNVSSSLVRVTVVYAIE